MLLGGGGGGWRLTLVPVALTDLFVPGALVIFVVWLAISRLHIFLTRPLLRVLRWLSAILLFIAFLVTMLISLPISAMLKPLERRKIDRWEQQQDKRTLETWQRELGEDGFLEFARLRIRFRADYVDKLLIAFFPWLISQIVPAVIIGIAPVESFSFEEEQRSARIPSQLFAEAAGRLHARLERLAPGIQLRVHMLPTVVRVRFPLAAQRIRRWLGYDVVLWGSFTDQEARRLLINLATRRASARKPGGRERHAVQVERELGPLRPSGAAVKRTRRSSPTDPRLRCSAHGLG